MKKIIYAICATLAIIYLSGMLLNDLAANESGNDKEGEPSVGYVDETKIPSLDEEDIFIPEYALTNALATKMIALTFYNYGELLSMDDYVEFEDCNKEDWFYYYVNAAIANDWIDGEGDLFNPYGLVSKEGTQSLFKNLNNYGEAIDLNQYELKGEDPISTEEFMKIYMDYVGANKNKSKVKLDQLIVFATPLVSDELGSWQMATDKGIYDFSGLTVDKQLNQSSQFLVNEKHIIAVLNTVDLKPTLTNTYIVNRSGDDMTVFMGGVSREFTFSGTSDIEANEIADIVLDQNEVIEVYPKREAHKGVIKKVNDSFIELEDGIYPFTKDMKVYSNVGGKLGWKGKSHLIVGTDMASFIIDDEGICTAIINVEPTITDIRVALNVTGFKGLSHQQVKITSDSEFILNLAGAEKSYGPSEVLQIGGDKGLDIGDERVYIYPKDSHSKLQILSIERGYGSYRKNPEYRGTLEVAKQGEGYTIVNELGMEEYLYAVVPSEMPSSYGVEASMVQAVTARSYAYNQMYSNRFHAYGAHVDDSTACQVYNNIPENDTSIQGVNQTKGLGLKSGNNVVSANFFSTSCGYTANSGDVWSNYTTKQFPSTTAPYLVAAPQYESGDFGDLSKEENFYNFIKTNEVDAYDKYFPWFRWKVTMTLDEIEASINHNLQKLYEARPHTVRTLDENSIFRSEFIDGVGELKDIYVYKRGEGGIIMEIIIEGSERTVKVSTELVIRQLIRAVQYIDGGNPIKLTKSDGSVVKDFGNMPSAFYTMEKIKDKDGQLLEINFIGGGYGHGVGMSQNGVKGMVDEGYTFKKILEHYYSGISIEPIY